MERTDAEIVAEVRKMEKDAGLSRAMQNSLNDKATQAELDALTAHLEGCTPVPGGD